MNYCSYCHNPIPHEAHPYTLRLELFPAVEPTLELDPSTLGEDYHSELQRIIEAMEQMTDEQVDEQEKLMYVSHSFTLCRACRDRIAAQLDRLQPPGPEA